MRGCNVPGLLGNVGFTYYGLSAGLPCDCPISIILPPGGTYPAPSMEYSPIHENNVSPLMCHIVSYCGHVIRRANSGRETNNMED